MCNLLTLSDEILFQIAIYLSPKTLRDFSLTSSIILNIYKSKYFWQLKLKYDYPKLVLHNGSSNSLNSGDLYKIVYTSKSIPIKIRTLNGMEIYQTIKITQTTILEKVLSILKTQLKSNNYLKYYNWIWFNINNKLCGFDLQYPKLNVELKDVSEILFDFLSEDQIIIEKIRNKCKMLQYITCDV